jgi:hypothetical protein
MLRRRLLIFEDHFRRIVHPNGESAEVSRTEAAERIGFLNEVGPTERAESKR